MDRQKWLQDYRKNKRAIWIRCKLTNGDEFNYDHFEGWKELKQKCEKEKLFFSELCIQYRSHQSKIDIEDSEGIYLIRSIKGQIGGESTHYYTIGTIHGDIVKKKMLITPELIVETEYEDSIENCFEEAIIYDKTKEN